MVLAFVGTCICQSNLSCRSGWSILDSIELPDVYLQLVPAAAQDLPKMTIDICLQAWACVCLPWACLGSNGTTTGGGNLSPHAMAPMTLKSQDIHSLVSTCQRCLCQPAELLRRGLVLRSCLLQWQQAFERLLPISEFWSMPKMVCWVSLRYRLHVIFDLLILQGTCHVKAKDYQGSLTWFSAWPQTKEAEWHDFQLASQLTLETRSWKWQTSEPHATTRVTSTISPSWSCASLSPSLSLSHVHACEGPWCQILFWLYSHICCRWLVVQLTCFDTCTGGTTLSTPLQALGWDGFEQLSKQVHGIYTPICIYMCFNRTSSSSIYVHVLCIGCKHTGCAVLLHISH